MRLSYAKKLAAKMRASGDGLELRAEVRKVDRDWRIYFCGGKWGEHSLDVRASDRARVVTHWDGYTWASGVQWPMPTPGRSREGVIEGYVHGARVVNGIAHDRGGMTVRPWGNGAALASIRIVKSRRVRSWLGSRVYYFQGEADGQRYYGRGFGEMMFVRLFPYK